MYKLFQRLPYFRTKCILHISRIKKKPTLSTINFNTLWQFLDSNLPEKQHRKRTRITGEYSKEDEIIKRPKKISMQQNVVLEKGDRLALQKLEKHFEKINKNIERMSNTLDRCVNILEQHFSK